MSLILPPASEREGGACFGDVWAIQTRHHARYDGLFAANKHDRGTFARLSLQNTQAARGAYCYITSSLSGDLKLFLCWRRKV